MPRRPAISLFRSPLADPASTSSSRAEEDRRGGRADARPPRLGQAADGLPTSDHRRSCCWIPRRVRIDVLTEPGRGGGTHGAQPAPTPLDGARLGVPFHVAIGVPVPFRMTSRDDLAESGRPPGAPRGPMCSEHLKRTCAPAVQPPMDAPWGVCVVERQYRDRQASGRARSILQPLVGDSGAVPVITVGWETQALISPNRLRAGQVAVPVGVPILEVVLGLRRGLSCRQRHQGRRHHDHRNDLPAHWNPRFSHNAAKLAGVVLGGSRTLLADVSEQFLGRLRARPASTVLSRERLRGVRDPLRPRGTRGGWAKSFLDRAPRSA